MARKVRSVRKPRKSKVSESRSEEIRPETGVHGDKLASASGKPDAERGPDDLRSSEDELREEYDYVVRDLRRIAILAVLMFVLLIALNLLLR